MRIFEQNIRIFLLIQFIEKLGSKRTDYLRNYILCNIHDLIREPCYFDRNSQQEPDTASRGARPKQQWNKSTTVNDSSRVQDRSKAGKINQHTKIHVVRRMPNLGRRPTIDE